jgi:hypothetical protein
MSHTEQASLRLLHVTETERDYTKRTPPGLTRLRWQLEPASLEATRVRSRWVDERPLQMQRRQQ